MNQLIVVVGPSGVGKTYLASLLKNSMGNKLRDVKIYTTRNPRSNESFSDRKHVSADQFKKLIQQGEIILSGQYSGNLYGWPASTFKENKTTSIVNIWPKLIPKFAILPNVIFVGLTINPNNIDVLTKRMHKRGDDSDKIQQRLELIYKEIKELAKQQELLNQHGKLFEITGDETIPQTVMPWLNSQLSL